MHFKRRKILHWLHMNKYPLEEVVVIPCSAVQSGCPKAHSYVLIVVSLHGLKAAMEEAWMEREAQNAAEAKPFSATKTERANQLLSSKSPTDCQD
jgi:hypothetical protein